MPLKEVDLRGVYSVDPALSMEMVDAYFSMGIDYLLYLMSDDPIDAQVCKKGDGYLIEIVNGCHRAKALYRHGIWRVEMEVYGNENDFGRLGHDAASLIDVPELKPEEYERWRNGRRLSTFQALGKAVNKESSIYKG